MSAALENFFYSSPGVMFRKYIRKAEKYGEKIEENLNFLFPGSRGKLLKLFNFVGRLSFDTFSF